VKWGTVARGAACLRTTLPKAVRENAAVAIASAGRAEQAELASSSADVNDDNASASERSE
jgi:hypothetical protein